MNTSTLGQSGSFFSLKQPTYVFDSIGEGMAVCKVMQEPVPLREVRRVCNTQGPFAGLWIGTPCGWIRALEPSHAAFLPSGDPALCRWWNISRYSIPIFAECRTSSPRVGSVDPGRSCAVHGVRQSPCASAPPTPGGDPNADGASSLGMSSHRSASESALCWLRVTAPREGWAYLGDGVSELYFAPERVATTASIISTNPLSWIPVRSSALAMAVETFDDVLGGMDLRSPGKVAGTMRRSSRAVLSLSKSFAVSAAMADDATTQAVALRRVLSCGMMRARSGSFSGEPTANSSPAPTFTNNSVTPTFSMPERWHGLEEPIGFEAAGWQAPNNLARQDDSDRSLASLAESGVPLVSPNSQRSAQATSLPNPTPGTDVVLCAYEERDERTSARCYVTSVRVGESTEYTFNGTGITAVNSSGRSVAKQYAMGRTLLNPVQVVEVLQQLKAQNTGHIDPAPENEEVGIGYRRPFVPYSFDAATHNSHHFCEAFLRELLWQQNITPGAAAPRIPAELTSVPTLANGAVAPALSRKLSAAFTKQ